jgi:CDP-glucose 4,6-dehydratase
MGGHDPYSSSKGCAELVTSAYRSSYFSKENDQTHSVALASARAGNVIGGGDWAGDRLIPDIVQAVMENRSVAIRNPNATRPWQHVLEPLEGYLSLAEKLWGHGEKFSGGWNFGPDDKDCRAVSWIVKHLNHLWDGDIHWELDSAENPHEATYLKLDCSKAKRLLGWSPKLTLFTALEWVVEWYQGYLNHMDMRELSKGQISRYENVGLA